MKYRAIASVAGAILLIWLIVGIVLAGRYPPAPPPANQSLTLRGGIVTGHRMSTKSWSFRYKKVEISPDGTFASVDGIRQGVLFKGGAAYLGLSAQHVSVNTQTFDFTAIGDVHITELSGGSHRSFDTDFIQWINATKILTLPHPSVVRGGGQTLRVASIKMNFNTGEIRLMNVSGGVAP